MSPYDVISSQLQLWISGYLDLCKVKFEFLPTTEEALFNDVIFHINALYVCIYECAVANEISKLFFNVPYCKVTFSQAYYESY